MSDPIEAITITDIDQALIDHFQAVFLSHDRLVSRLIKVDGKEVDLFIEAPDMAHVSTEAGIQDRRFPAVSFELDDISTDDDRLESYDEDVVVWSNSANSRKVHEQPQPYRVRYNIHAFSRNVHHDRCLVQQLIASFAINGTLQIAGGYWSTEMDDIIQSDQYFQDVDQITYHKIWPIDIIAVMFPTNLFREEPLVIETVTEYPVGTVVESWTFDGTDDTFETN